MNTFDKRTLRKITSALESLCSSTYLSVRVPFGPQVDTWGRNGRNPKWAVKDKAPTMDGLNEYFTFDNGKYSAIVSSYFVNLYLDFEVVYTPMPVQTILPLFRGVGEVFLASSPEGVRRMFFPWAVVHVWVASPYVELLKIS